MDELICGTCGQRGQVGDGFDRTFVRQTTGPNGGQWFELRCACGEVERVGSAALWANHGGRAPARTR